MKVGFVVLCYDNYAMVEQCIAKIQELDEISSSEIVIVDNYSPSGMGEILKDEFLNISNVTVILNTENVGFAKGNNLGYSYAKNNLGCDIIVVMNSDVYIDQHDFIPLLKKITVENPEFSVIAPDVLGKDSRHTNPLCRCKESKKNVYINILKNCLANILLFLHMDYYKKKKTNDNSANVKQERLFGIMPHGSCVIYTPKWISIEARAFYPYTFLFCEEYFLASYAEEKGHIVVYIPELFVAHVGDASIDVNSKSERKKRMFVNKKQTESLLKYLKFEKNVEKNWGK